MGVSEMSWIQARLTVLAAVAGVYPDFGGVGGSGVLESVIGAVMSIVLVVAVLMIVVCAATWTICCSQGNAAGAGKARTGVLVALGAAILDGGGIAWLNFLLHVGRGL